MFFKYKLCTGVLLFIGVLSYINAKSYYPGIIPTPQKTISKPETIPVNVADFKVIISKDGVKSRFLAKHELLKKVRELSNKDSRAFPVTVYLGRSGSDIFPDAVKDLAGKLSPQGYSIRYKKDNGKLIIYASGVDNRGVFYAASTLMQMLTADKGQAVLKISQLDDWPLWKIRYMGAYTPIRLARMKALARYKISAYAMQHRYDWKKFSPNEKPMNGRVSSYLEGFETIKRFREQNGDLVDFMMMIHVYAHKKRINIGDAKQVAALIKKCEFAAKYVDAIMIQLDDYGKTKDGEYIFSFPEEQKKFKSVGQAQGWLITQIYNMLQQKSPKVRLSVCPASYDLQAGLIPGKTKYLKELASALPEDVSVVWTGPYCVSRKVTKAQHDKFSELVLGHRLLLWDNSNDSPSRPYAQWNTSFFPGMEKLDGGQIYLNGHGFAYQWSQTYMIHSNSYLWNPAGYKMKESYHKALGLLGVKKPQSIDEVIRLLVLLKRTYGRKEAAKVSKSLIAAVEEMEKNGIPDVGRIKPYAMLKYKENSNPVPSLNVMRIRQEPQLDGKLNDKCWSKLPFYSMSLQKTRKKALNKTAFKIAYDNNNLYLGFSCSNNKKLPAPFRLKRDSTLNKADVIAIRLIPPSGNRRTGIFNFDCYGNLYDGKEWVPIQLYNPKWKVAVKRSPSGSWTAEVKIPFAELNRHLLSRYPASGTRWFGNFMRFNNVVNENSSWSKAPTNAVHLNKQYYGYLDFK